VLRSSAAGIAQAGSSTRGAHAAARALRSPWLHVGLVVVASAWWEALYLHHGLNALDEGWPLYAAMQLHEGGRLYREVFWVFPPGHVLPAWIAYALDPPGLVGARAIYAAFTVALCASLYVLGRRLMSPGYALLGAGLLAISTPVSHHSQLLFGYRYLVFAVLALWLFSERLHTGDRRWLVAAGACTGIALLFRLSPAGAAAAGVGVGILAAHRSWRELWGDGLHFAAGLVLVAAPAVLWLAHGVGLETLWREAVVRPMVMTDLQSKPVPALGLPPSWDRALVRMSFVTVQFRLYALLFLGYTAVLGIRWIRDLRAGRPFPHPLLLATAVAGGVFFVRALGRSDEPHLDSALPPACLLLAHAASAGASRLGLGTLGRGALGVALFGAWIMASAADRYLAPSLRGSIPVETLGGETAIRRDSIWRPFDRLVRIIQREVPPDAPLLDMTSSPLLHVAAGRRAYGGPDVIMPGTFLDAAEERAALEKLRRSPPALIVTSRTPFDDRPERGIDRTAPRITGWVRESYRPWRTVGRFRLWKPKETAPTPAGG